jgi:murein tripeptide amidase MpaA
MPYLNVVEVESALQLVAATHPGFTELVTLPHRTWENRVCRAVRVAADLATARPTVVLFAGVHAREWGGPDILVSFLERLTAAVSDGAEIALPGYTVPTADVERIGNGLDVVVFPQANPDGRAYSMRPDGNEMWRTNRRPSPVGGVDVNRNYDWLWDFRRYFDPRALTRGEVSVSDTRGNDTYHGPEAFSEPETRNVAWLVDRYPTTRFLTDVHSFSELILYPWGDDDNQTTKPEQNFHNPAFDRKRGLLAQNGHPDARRYGEYLDPTHRQHLIEIGTRMRDAVQSVNGRTYTLQQGAQLYGTSGTSDDWSFARHILDPARPVIYPYTIEFGRELPNDVAASFHPPYADMEKIIDEVVAGSWKCASPDSTC